jgi:gliding motility-associated protein GldL
MKFAELVHSSGWKNFMAKMYGIGASIVIMGALFKIQAWPGAGIMLTVGLSVEAMIFFFSAFEPLHEELDWTLVYPELAGMQEDSDMPSLRQSSRSQQLPAQAYSGGGGNSAALAKFDQMIQNAEITPELFERLGQGLKNLHLTTSKLADISDASLATNEYVSNLRNAAISVNTLNESFENSSRNLQGNVDGLSESYRKNADIVNTFNESVDRNRAGIGENLGTLNKNLSALNAVYELQLQNNNDHLKGSQAIFSDLNKMNGNLQSSLQDTEKYREEISKLSQNLSELNSIYGNMLSAMNVVSRKR